MVSGCGVCMDGDAARFFGGGRSQCALTYLLPLVTHNQRVHSYHKARAADTADRPANCLLAWALVEEREGATARSRELMEMAVTAEPSSSYAWSAYLRFVRRVHGVRPPLISFSSPSLVTFDSLE